MIASGGPPSLSISLSWAFSDSARPTSTCSMIARQHDHGNIDHRRGTAVAAPRAAPSTGGASDILQRALAWSTADLDAASAARRRAEALASPDWAARHAYALGYWEGGAAVEVLLADDLRALERQLADSRARLARPLWRQVAAHLARWRCPDRRGVM